MLPRSPCSTHCNDHARGEPSFPGGSYPVCSLPEPRNTKPGGPCSWGCATPVLVAEGRSAARLTSGVCDTTRDSSLLVCVGGSGAYTLKKCGGRISWLSLPLLRLLLILLLLFLPQAVRGQTIGVGNVMTLAGSLSGVVGVNNYGHADGVGISASFYLPWGVAMDSAGTFAVVVRSTMGG